MVTLKLPYEVLVTHRVMTPANDHSNVVPGLRVKRELAQFHLSGILSLENKFGR